MDKYTSKTKTQHLKSNHILNIYIYFFKSEKNYSTIYFGFEYIFFVSFYFSNKKIYKKSKK